jgi:hypothetical protein
MTITVRANPVNLTWDNFRPVDSIPDADEDGEVAQVNPEVSFPQNIRPQQQSRGVFRLPDFTVAVAPNVLNTMVLNTANKTDDLLRHEQGHYNLLILVARAMARELQAATGTSAQDLGNQLQQIRTTHMNRAQSIDSSYDTQTDHGRNTDEQTRWNNLISAAMANANATEINGMSL